MTDPLHLACMAKISILKKEGIEKISYERRAYESVDDRTKQNSGTNGLM